MMDTPGVRDLLPRILATTCSSSSSASGGRGFPVPAPALRLVCGAFRAVMDATVITSIHINADRADADAAARMVKGMPVLKEVTLTGTRNRATRIITGVLAQNPRLAAHLETLTVNVTLSSDDDDDDDAEEEEDDDTVMSEAEATPNLTMPPPLTGHPFASLTKLVINGARASASASPPLPDDNAHTTDNDADPAGASPSALDATQLLRILLPSARCPTLRHLEVHDMRDTCLDLVGPERRGAAALETLVLCNAGRVEAWPGLADSLRRLRSASTDVTFCSWGARACFRQLTHFEMIVNVRVERVPAMPAVTRFILGGCPLVETLSCLAPAQPDYARVCSCSSLIDVRGIADCRGVAVLECIPAHARFPGRGDGGARRDGPHPTIKVGAVPGLMHRDVAAFLPAVHELVLMDGVHCDNALLQHPRVRVGGVVYTSLFG